MSAVMRTFDSGATRNLDASKLDYEGFLSPLVLERFAQYMHVNRVQADGSLRSSDNWQKGIPPEAYMKSGFRHFMDWWKEHRGIDTDEGVEQAICGLLFNAMGYLHERLKAAPYEEQAVQQYAEAPMAPAIMDAVIPDPERDDDEGGPGEQPRNCS
jgi:hypothetical protein